MKTAKEFLESLTEEQCKNIIQMALYGLSIAEKQVREFPKGGVISKQTNEDILTDGEPILKSMPKNEFGANSIISQLEKRLKSEELKITYVL